MKKRGFTIVELVIVIAVIAILAAVLIPTFSNIIKKTNLSADKQAVREMNMALAEWEAAHGYDRSTLHFTDESGNLQTLDVDSVMYILGSAGLNTDNWSCLTEGYEVYWYENENRMVLYNASTHEIEYPEEYDKNIFINNESSFHIYNENHVKALEINFSLSEVNVESAKDNAISSNSADSEIKRIISGNATDAEVAVIKNAAAKIGSNDTIKSALGGNTSSSVSILAASSNTSSVGNATVSMENLCVTTGDSAADVILRSDGTLKTNVVYISVNTTASTSATELRKAGQQIGKNIHDIFANINESKLDQDVNILIDLSSAYENGQEVVLDCSTVGEWEPVKRFAGTFGSTDPQHKLVVTGAKLSSATGYASTTYFDGNSSKYFLTGFFGAVYGDAVIQNVIFENLTIEKPANNYTLEAEEANTKANSRNTVGIIGGIIDSRIDRKLTDSEAQKIGLPVDASKSIAGLTKITVKGTEYTYDSTTYSEANGFGGKTFKIGDKLYVCDSTEKKLNGASMNPKQYYNVWYEVNGTQAASTVNVKIINVEVRNTVTIRGCGCAGGLIGYIGSSATMGRALGNIEIKNCVVNATVYSADTTSGDGYGTVGGLVGFFCRDTGIYASIDGCTVGASLYGYKRVGGAIGSSSWGAGTDRVVFKGTNDFSGVKIHSYVQTIGVAALFNGDLAKDRTLIKNEGTIYYTDKDADGNTITALRGSNDTTGIGGTISAK